MTEDDLRSVFSLQDKSGLFHERISSESAALFSKMINLENVVTEIPDLSEKKRPIALDSESVTGNTVFNANPSAHSPRGFGFSGGGVGVTNGNGEIAGNRDNDSYYKSGGGDAQVQAPENIAASAEDVRPIGRNMSFFKRLVSKRSANAGGSPSPRFVEELPMVSATVEDEYYNNNNAVTSNNNDEVIPDNSSELTSISRKERHRKRKEEREFYEKREYLLDLEKYARLGFEVQKYTLDDPLIKIQYEWERNTLMIQSLERVETIKMWIRGGVMIIYGISYIFTNKLDGWMIAVNNEIDNPRYIPAFEEIYREQFQRNPPNPKMQLLWMLLSTAALTIVANLTSVERQTIGNYGKHAITTSTQTPMTTQNQAQATAQASAATQNQANQNPLGGLGGLVNMFGGGGMGSLLSMAGKILPAVLGGASGSSGAGGSGGGMESIGRVMQQMMGGMNNNNNSFVPPPRAPIIPPS